MSFWNKVEPFRLILLIFVFVVEMTLIIAAFHEVAFMVDYPATLIAAPIFWLLYEIGRGLAKHCI